LLCANLATKHLSGVANSKAELAILLALKDAIRLFLKYRNILNIIPLLYIYIINFGPILD
jgi:hypothetical protein